MRKTYPNNLKVIIAYEKDGKPLEGGSDGEGPLRLIVPQNKPGKHDQGGDPNTPKCERMACSVEVDPLPAGTQVPPKSSVPEGSLAVYGAVKEPPTPAPPAPPQNQQQPSGTTQSSADTQQTQSPAAIQAVSGKLFSGPAGFFTYWAGVALSAILAPQARFALCRAFLMIGAMK